MEFGWDSTKNAKNIEKHEIDFADVKPLFDSTQPYLDKEDDREDYGEERRIRLGWLHEVPVYVVYTVRGQFIWLISARLAEPAEEEVLVADTEGEKWFQKAQWEREQSIEQKKKKEKSRIETKKEREQR